MAVLDDMSQCIKQEVQVSRERRTSGYVMVQPHYHSYYEIYYLLSGQCKMFINQDIYYMRPGDVLLIPPMEIHKVLYEADQEALRFGICFTREAAKGFYSGCNQEVFDSLFSMYKIVVPEECRAQVENLCLQMQGEDRLKDVYSHVLVQSFLNQFLVLLGRCRCGEQEKEALGAAEESVMRAVRYIHEHYPEALTLKGAAGIAHMSPTYFSKKFKGTTGLGFKEYLNFIRLQTAAGMLQSTDDTITEIAVACGFSDGNYFGDVFKQAKGISPNQFRREVRSNKPRSGVGVHPLP